MERGECGSTEEHLTVTQFKVAQEQQRLEDVTAQIAQTEQTLDTAQAAVEKKQKELQSLQKQAKKQRTAALTVQEIRSMGKKTITGNITLTPSECSTLKDYAVNGILAKAENSRLEEKLQSAQKSAAVWKQRYESPKEQARPYLEAVKLATEKVWAFLDAILTQTRQTRQHDQPVHRKSQDMELLIDGGNCMRKHKDFMNESDYGYIDIESCLDPIFEPVRSRAWLHQPENSGG